MKEAQNTLSAQLNGKFELRGYVPGPMGLSDGSMINWCHATLEQAERIYSLGLAGKHLVKIEPKPAKKKASDEPSPPNQAD